jgi:hypothetical protein
MGRSGDEAGRPGDEAGCDGDEAGCDGDEAGRVGDVGGSTAGGVAMISSCSDDVACLALRRGLGGAVPVISLTSKSKGALGIEVFGRFFPFRLLLDSDSSLSSFRFGA